MITIRMTLITMMKLKSRSLTSVLMMEVMESLILMLTYSLRYLNRQKPLKVCLSLSIKQISCKNQIGTEYLLFQGIQGVVRLLKYQSLFLKLPYLKSKKSKLFVLSQDAQLQLILLSELHKNLEKKWVKQLAIMLVCNHVKLAM